jgi:hypothetical protein
MEAKKSAIFLLPLLKNHAPRDLSFFSKSWG